MQAKIKGDGQEEQVVVFQLLDQNYGVDIEKVYEIIRMETITKVPRAPLFIEGVINLRGRIIPVIDLCKRFNLVGSVRAESSRIIIVEVGGATIGMIVDAVLEVLRIPVEKIEPPPPVVSGINASYLKGIALWGERLIILFELDKIFYESEKAQISSQMEECIPVSA